MRRPFLRPCAAALLALAAACGGNPAPGSVNFDRNRISPAEIEEGSARNVTNAYDLIQSIRPNWLRPTRTGLGGAANEIVVYENQTRIGSIATLRNVPLANISAIRWLSASEAGGEFGQDVNYGAIQIITRTGR